MTTETNEKSLEELIEACFLSQGYLKGLPQDYNKTRCIDEKILFSFIKNTQPEEFEKIKKRNGANYQDIFCKRIFDQVQQNGIIEVLRKGVMEGDIKINLLYGLPTSNKNPQTQANYQIIKSFNDRWGNTEWCKNDKVKKMLFEDLPAEIALDEEYIKATKQASAQNTKITFNNMMEEKFQDLMFDFTDLYRDFSDNKDFKQDVLGMMFDIVMKKQGAENRMGN